MFTCRRDMASKPLHPPPLGGDLGMDLRRSPQVRIAGNHPRTAVVGPLHHRHRFFSLSTGAVAVPTRDALRSALQRACQSSPACGELLGRPVENHPYMLGLPEGAATRYCGWAFGGGTCGLCLRPTRLLPAPRATALLSRIRHFPARPKFQSPPLEVFPCA